MLPLQQSVPLTNSPPALSRTCLAFGLIIATLATAPAAETDWVYFEVTPQEALVRAGDDATELDPLTLAATIGDTKTAPTAGAQSPAEAVVYQTGKQQRIVGRYPAGESFTGWVYRLLVSKDNMPTEPAEDAEKQSLTWYRIPISVSGSQNDLHAKHHYWRAIISNSKRLLSQSYTGGAWFRHQHQQAVKQLQSFPGSKASADVNRAWSPRPNGAMSLLSGGRAVSENLPLSESMETPNRRRGAGANNRTDNSSDLVSIGDEPGVTVAPIQWKIDETKRTRKDYASQFIPHDQHVVFLPDGPAALALKNETNRLGAAAIAAVQQSATSSSVWQRYERQLGIPVDNLSTWLVAPLVQQIAVTGSDPYFQTGTDLAVLLVSKRPTLLKSMVLARRKSYLKDAAETSETIAGINCSVIRTPDRSISSYLARVGQCVIITNSPAQIRAIADVKSGKRPALSSEDEYTWFRQRYLRGQPETALLLISDPTIRRWCSAHWRVGSARRTWAAALLSQQTTANAVAHGDRHVDRQDASYDSNNPTVFSRIPTTVDPNAITSSGTGLDTKFHHDVYGNLDFMTPISELEIDKWTLAERDAYRAWLQAFERRFRNKFDPIGLRLYQEGSRWHTDLTVLPLRSFSEYTFLKVVTGDARIVASDMDSHQEAMFHATVAIDPNSMYALFARSYLLGGDSGQDAVGHFGSLYVDMTPEWLAQAAAAVASDGDLSTVMEDAPVGIRIAVDNVEAFDSGLRKFAGPEAPLKPGFTPERQQYRGKDIVKLTADKGRMSPIWYVLLDDAVTFSPSRSVITRAVDRFESREAAQGDEDSGSGVDQVTRVSRSDPKEATSNGNSMITQMTGEAIRLMAHSDRSYTLRAISWRNLPILDALKKAFPGRDPAKIYQKLTGQTIVCPAGGEYQWNERYRCHESTIFGHPMLARGKAITPGGPAVLPAAVPPSVAAIKTLDFRTLFELDGIRVVGAIDFKDQSQP